MLAFRQRLPAVECPPRLPQPAAGRGRILWWGLTRRCPRCGSGHLFRKYFTLIPDCGHVPYIEGKETFVRVLDAFLPKTGRA